VTAGSVKVAYIGGLGRSGSTLLDRILGQIPGFFSAGEIRDLWQRGLRENRLCGCGTPFRDCTFWTNVGEEAFGGWDRVDLDEVQAAARTVDRHGLVPLLIAPKLWPPFHRSLRRYTSTLSALYGAIRDVGNTRLIVDSSKAPSSAFVLRQLPDLDLRAIHLIRDSRGVAYSWAKQVVRPDVVGKVVYMHRYRPHRIGLRWVTRNALMELLGRLGVPEVRVRYESLVTSPRVEVERIVRMVDEEVPAEDLSFISNGHVELRANHTVMGNPMRMDSGKIVLRMDDEWRRAMHPSTSGMVTLLTRPMLRRYGYRP
jgi:hypothetical protein